MITVGRLRLGSAGSAGSAGSGSVRNSTWIRLRDLEAQGVELVHSKEKISQSQGQGESTDIYWHFLDLCLDLLVAVLLFLLLLESFTLMFAYCLKSK